MNLIEIKNLKKKYKDTIVLDIPTLSFSKGNLCAIVGNNGAGKTTLFRCMLDLILPSDGNVFSKEKDVKKSEDWKFYTASYLDEGFIIDYLTPEEYFYFIGSLKNYTTKAVDESLEFLMPFFREEILGKKKLIRDFSKGNIQKIGIAGCFVLNAEIILLDEPFANLDPTSRIILTDLILQHQKAFQTTFLISSHDISSVSALGQRIILMEKGKVIKDLLYNTESMQEVEEYFANIG